MLFVLTGSLPPGFPFSAGAPLGKKLRSSGSAAERRQLIKSSMISGNGRRETRMENERDPPYRIAVAEGTSFGDGDRERERGNESETVASAVEDEADRVFPLPSILALISNGSRAGRR